MVLCIVIHVMPEYALDWVPGSGICLYQETLYQSVSCRRRLRRTAPCETPGMATQVRLAFHRRYWCSSIACRSTGQQSSAPSPRGGTLIFCGYIGEAPASTPKPKKLLRFADHPKKIPVLSGIPQKILELLAYPKKLHVFIFFMPIDEISSHPYDLSCWWDVKSQIIQPTEHVTIQLVYVGTRK